MADHPSPTESSSAVANRDLRIIYAVQGLRALAYGFGSILIGAELARGGYSPARASLVFTAMLAGFALMSILVGARGDRTGRRRLYGGLFLVMAGVRTPLPPPRWVPALLFAALTRALSTGATQSGTP